MNNEFVIDGTDIISNLTQERLLAPLLQLLLHLHDEKKSFYCYFDADTRYKFTRDIDKQLYQSIIKFGLNDCFNQATAGDADRLILKQANDISANIISANTYQSFTEDFDWLTTNTRVFKPQIVDNQLKVIDTTIDISIDTDVAQLAVRLIKALEIARNNLQGTIDRYKTDRDFGFIRRSIGNKKLFFHKAAVTDENLDFRTPDTPVSFDLDIDNSGEIYYFCAVNITERVVTQEDVVEKLSAERKELSASKDFLQQQAVELKNSFERELQEVLQRNKALQSENKTLQNELELYKGSGNEVVKRIETERKAFNEQLERLQQTIGQKDTKIEALQREIDLLNAQKQAALQALDRKVAESNSQAVMIDFQEEKITNLDEDLKAALRLVQMPQLKQSEAVRYEELKEEYNILLNSVTQKNSQIAFLNNNLQDLQTQLARTSSSENQSIEIEQLIEKVKDLEVNNEILKTQVDQLEEQNQKALLGNNTPQTEATPTTSDDNTTVVTLSEEAKLHRNKRPEKVIVKATKTDLENWWNGLEEQWKFAFNQTVLTRGEVLTTPEEDQLRSLFKRKKIDIVGSGILFFGLNQLSFKLTNLSGLKELSQVEELNISGHDLQSLEGIEHFENLDFLNCTSNQITTIEQIQDITTLKTLIIQDNNLLNLQGIEKMNQLEYFNCLYNGTLTSISRINHLPNLQIFCVDNYKTIIRLQLEELEKVHPKLEIRNV